ncbi:receptor activity-modifying protein 2 isoform X1 [Panthera pardus]|uniref:Receptor activity-modifying protein 2 n=1 Tax=Panthera pardus TaxID=9691 RepID=A0A9W2URA8_PANPR|nr:receptor activity-modifying protein 2 isoform X1 [Panthera leo]XP_042822777.1 receptor activity-modifying protein 2 isoform X1 [Panthera tigris]XP_049492107.1 receptor activity-modifying protein 2 isoform X1 [Panthera uncia]XP_053748725.1 receptor activity-modifying protein 2 isoform X1 [Panthera pardus]XP_060502006.1 receptor activity-modifying protein 2 isoform X1 [Panthera onca]
MASLRAERAAGGPRFSTTLAGRPAALRLLLLLGALTSKGLRPLLQAPPPRSPPSSFPPPFLLTAVLKPQESLAQLLPTEGSLKSEENKMEDYKVNARFCWQSYKEQMDSIPKDWCDWTMISRPYSDLQYCLEHFAEAFGLGFPNPLAEEIIFETHQIHFANCSLMQPTLSDPPEDVLLAMIIAPICLIPFLVTLVVWRSKDSEAQA